MVKDESIMNLMIPKPSGGDKNLRTFGLIVFLSTASYYCIQVAKVYLWPFSLVVEVALLVSLVAFYLFFVASKPEVHCDNQKFKAFVRKRMPMLKERYWITPWAWEGNIHTFMASLFGNLWPFAPKEVTYSREVLQLKDGGEVALDWKHECGLASPPSTDDESDDSGVKMSENGRQHHGQHPVVLIMPGITGDSSMVYVRSLVLEFSKLGVCCVVFNNRGLGGMKLKTARTYCGCNTDDVEEVVQHLKRSLPHGTPLASVGVSLGALIMCHYLSKKGKDTGFLGSVAICPPWDVFKGCELLETGWPNRYFNYHIAHCLHEIYDREKAIFEEQIGGGPAAKATSALVLSSRTIREFDDRFTAPQFGYPSVDAYYADARMTEKLQNVRTPLLGLAAADDPFHPADGIPVEFGPEAPVAMVVTKRGGHIGYLEGVLPYLSGPPYYARLARDFMAAVFSSREKVEEIIQDVSRN